RQGPTGCGRGGRARCGRAGRRPRLTRRGIRRARKRKQPARWWVAFRRRRGARAVMHKHYDVIVLGRSIGALVAAALLARRDFTVLVLGQGDRPASYRLEHRVLLRRAFTMLGATSPAWRRVVVELAQSQTWKRRVASAWPMLQFLVPRRRLDVPPDMALFGREIDREFPELRRVVDELYTDLARVNGLADEVFERDAVWPPGTFWERRETRRH